ncbi:MAG: helix-turn-helix transcriptional regulator [Burkholderiales bacterium]|nr:MAG: helix-turn-helix transcriptional regulator [Burkholderiales bacterium]
MFLSSTEQTALKACFAWLAEDLGEREIRERVGQATLELFRADHFASFVWNPQRREFGECVQINMSPSNLTDYQAWFQYNDPITFFLQARRHATLVSEVMPRSSFVRTAFFNDFLARDGLHWGINLHAFDGTEALGDLRIWRGRTRNDFDARDKMLLDLLEPAFVAALRRAKKPAGPPQVQTTETLATLSPREKEVAQCVCRGLTDKEIARMLNISLPSVRTYMGRLFEKLGVHRRAGLARLADRFH